MPVQAGLVRTSGCLVVRLVRRLVSRDIQQFIGGQGRLGSIFHHNVTNPTSRFTHSMCASCTTNATKPPTQTIFQPFLTTNLQNPRRAKKRQKKRNKNVYGSNRLCGVFWVFHEYAPKTPKRQRFFTTTPGGEGGGGGGDFWAVGTKKN